MWIHEWFDIGRPRTNLSEYEAAADGNDPADLPPWVLCGVSGR
jgi:hypothetical protein